MAKKISDLTFNMNKKMTDYIIQINNIKQEMLNFDINSQDYKTLKEEFEDIKKKFIDEFQTINSIEIEEYLKLTNEYNK